MLNAILGDAHLRDTAADVVIRYARHDQYGRDEAKAIKALARRSAGQPEASVAEVFRFMLALLEATRKAVAGAPRLRPPGQKYNQPGDVDAKSVLSSLRAEFPDHGDEVLSTFIEWTIYWDYLR